VRDDPVLFAAFLVLLAHIALAFCLLTGVVEATAESLDRDRRRPKPMTPEQIALKMAAEFLGALLAAAPRLFEIFRAAGGRDGLLTALDATLATARSKADADLAAKHGG
jgi:hypothetical protein